MNTNAQLKVNWEWYSKIIIKAFCLRVFSNISLMGKERNSIFSRNKGTYEK